MIDCWQTSVVLCEALGDGMDFVAPLGRGLFESLLVPAIHKVCDWRVRSACPSSIPEYVAMEISIWIEGEVWRAHVNC